MIEHTKANFDTTKNVFKKEMQQNEKSTTNYKYKCL